MTILTPENRTKKDIYEYISFSLARIESPIYVRSKEIVNFELLSSRRIATYVHLPPITQHFIFKRAGEKYVKICVAYFQT